MFFSFSYFYPDILTDLTCHLYTLAQENSVIKKSKAKLCFFCLYICTMKEETSPYLDLIHISNPSMCFSQSIFECLDVRKVNWDIFCLTDYGFQCSWWMLLPKNVWKNRNPSFNVICISFCFVLFFVLGLPSKAPQQKLKNSNEQ